MQNPRFILETDLEPMEKQRAYEHFRRWSAMLEALERGELPSVGWGSACPDVVFVLNRELEHKEQQMLYRIADALRVPCYFTYDSQHLEQELSYLPGSAQIVRLGQDIPDIAEIMEDTPEVQEKKHQIWKYLRNLIRSRDVF